MVHYSKLQHSPADSLML